MQEPLQLVVGVEALGALQQGLVQLYEPLLGYGRLRDLDQRCVRLVGGEVILVHLLGVLANLVHPLPDLLD